MKSIKGLLNWKVLIVIFISITTLIMCVKDDDTNIIDNGGIDPIDNEEKYNWSIVINHHENYTDFTKAITVDGDDDFDWLYNGNNMNVVQFDNNFDTITIKNNSLKYKNIEIDFVYYTNTNIDTMQLDFKVYRNTELFDTKSYRFVNDFEQKFFYP